LHGSLYGTLALAKPSADRQRKVMQENELAFIREDFPMHGSKNAKSKTASRKSARPRCPSILPFSRKKTCDLHHHKTPAKSREIMNDEYNRSAKRCFFSQTFSF